MNLLCIFVLVFTLGDQGQSSIKQSFPITYGGKSFSLQKPPSDFPAPYKDLLSSYDEFARANSLVALCEPQNPCVILATQSNNELNKILKQAQKLALSFQKQLGDPAEKNLSPFPVFVFTKPKAYHQLIEELVRRNSYLADWQATAKSLAGFQLFVPPIVVILNDGKEQEEYRLDNQILHQIAHLLLGLKYGPQPFWLSEGIAWQFEEEMSASIYSFCYRSGFVSVGEHSGWMDDVKKLLQRKQLPSLEQVCQGGKEKFDKGRALASYGAARFFLNSKPEELKKFLKDYSKEQKEKFSSNPTQELDAARQIELIHAAFGNQIEQGLETFVANSRKR